MISNKNNDFRELGMWVLSGYLDFKPKNYYYVLIIYSDDSDLYVSLYKFGEKCYEVVCRKLSSDCEIGLLINENTSYGMGEDTKMYIITYGKVCLQEKLSYLFRNYFRYEVVDNRDKLSGELRGFKVKSPVIISNKLSSYLPNSGGKLPAAFLKKNDRQSDRFFDNRMIADYFFKINCYVTNKLGLQISAFNFPGVLSLYILICGFLKKKNGLYCGTNNEYNLYLSRCVVGGRRENFVSFADGVSSFDINNAYAYFAKKGIPCGIPMYEVNYKLSVETPALVEAEVEFNLDKTPILPLLNSNSICYPRGSFCGVWYSDELIYAENYGYKIKIKGAFVFAGLTFSLNEFLDAGISLKDSPFWEERFFGKLVTTSIFGKLSQKVDFFLEKKIKNYYLNSNDSISFSYDSKRYLYVPIVLVVVTARLRVFMNTIFEEVGYKNVFYVNCDCFHVDSFFSKLISIKYYGIFKVEFLDKSIFYKNNTKYYFIDVEFGEYLVDTCKDKNYKDNNMPAVTDFKSFIFGLLHNTKFFEMFNSNLYKNSSVIIGVYTSRNCIEVKTCDFKIKDVLMGDKTLLDYDFNALKNSIMSKYNIQTVYMICCIKILNTFLRVEDFYINRHELILLLDEVSKKNKVIQDVDLQVFDKWTNLSYPDLIKEFNRCDFPLKQLLSNYKTPVLLYLLKGILTEVSNKKLIFEKLENFKTKKFVNIYNNFVDDLNKAKNIKIDKSRLDEFFFQLVDLVNGFLLNKYQNINKSFFKAELVKLCVVYFEESQQSYRLSHFCFLFLKKFKIIRFEEKDETNSHVLVIGENAELFLSLKFISLPELIPGFTKNKKFLIKKLSKKNSEFLLNSEKTRLLELLSTQKYSYNYEASELLKLYLTKVAGSFNELKHPKFIFDSSKEPVSAAKSTKYKLHDVGNKKLYKEYIKEKKKFNKHTSFLNEIVNIHNACEVGDILKLLGFETFVLNRRMDSRGRVYSSGILSLEIGSLTRLLINSTEYNFIKGDSIEYKNYSEIFYKSTKITETDFNLFLRKYNESPRLFLEEFMSSKYFDDDKWVTLSYILDYFSVINTGVSKKIFYQDCSNSAYQMIAGMTGNKKIAEDSNVIFGDDMSFTKKDIYSNLLPSLNKDSILFTREMVKKPIMTTPYGVTTYGMIKKFDEFDLEWTESSKAAKILKISLDDRYPELCELMTLLKNYFTLCLLFDITELVFTIDGLKMDFVCRVVTDKKVVVNGERTILSVNTDKIDFKKTRNSITANLTHAHDAHFLSAMYFESKRGLSYKVLASIHDSFGSNFFDMGFIHHCAIEAYKKIFINNKDLYLHQIKHNLDVKYTMTSEELNIVMGIVNGTRVLDTKGVKKFSNIVGWGIETIVLLDKEGRDVKFTINVKKPSYEEILLLKFYYIELVNRSTNKLLSLRLNMVYWEFKKILY